MPNRDKFKSDEDHRKWYREYRQKNLERVRKYHSIYNKKYRKMKSNDPVFILKRRCRSKFNNALNNNKMQRGVCEICGEKEAQGHHADYSKPLEVRWFCALHHAQLENNIPFTEK